MASNKKHISKKMCGAGFVKSRFWGQTRLLWSEGSANLFRAFSFFEDWKSVRPDRLKIFYVNLAEFHLGSDEMRRRAGREGGREGGMTIAVARLHSPDIYPRRILILGHKKKVFFIFFMSQWKGMKEVARPLALDDIAIWPRNETSPNILHVFPKE